MRIVFVPGVWGGRWLFSNLEDYFAARGFETAPVQLLSSEQHALRFDDFLAITREQLSDPDQSYVIVGHSAGALLALRAAQELPNIKAVILISPAPPRGAMPIPTLTMISAGLRVLPALVRSKMVYPVYSVVMGKGMNRLDAESGKRLWRNMNLPEYRGYLFQLGLRRPKISHRAAPTLVIGVSDDLVISEKAAAKVSRYLSCDYVSLPGLGHLAPLENNWEDLANTMKTWLGDQGICPEQT